MAWFGEFGSASSQVCASAAAAVVPFVSHGGANSDTTTKNRRYPSLDALYRDIHANPELRLREARTAGLLARQMRDLGLEVAEKAGGTGMAALLRNGPGPTVLIRTELDGLPMREMSGAPFASVVRVPYKAGTAYVAPSCSHDVHMARWVGTAEALITLKKKWRGTVMFVAQPGEETGEGARKMIADGLFTRFPKPDYGFAAHVGNTVEVKKGAVTSNFDTIQIVFNGRGAHGSMPSASIDPVVMGAHSVADVQTIVSRKKDAFQFGVVTVGAFNAGSAPNITPDKAELARTLGSFSPEVRAKLVAGVVRTAKAAADMADAPPPTIDHAPGAGAVTNDSALVDSVSAVLRGADGDATRAEPETAPGSSASEDYSALVASGMRSVYSSVGGYDPLVIAKYEKRGETAPSNHSPYFLPDHGKAIRTGMRTLALATLSVLAISQ